MDSKRPSAGDGISTSSQYGNLYDYSRYAPFTYQSGQVNQTRLLTLLPGKHEDEIEIQIRVVRLADEELSDLKYECLSYVWGKKEPKRCIKVHVSSHECHFLEVTPNLFELLPYIRYDNRPRELWIDAVCINQADLKERSEQVQIMADIYTYSVHTIVWLGSGQDHDAIDEDLNLVRDLGRRIADLKAKRITLPDSGDSLERVNKDIIANPQYRSTIAKLLSYPWFGRLWIVQEILLSRESTLQIGLTLVPWQQFRGAFNYVRVFHNSLMPKRFRGEDSLLLFEEAFDPNEILVAIAKTAVDTDCENPRDRVYGVLGLMPERHRARLQSTVDYTRPIAEVYIEATKELTKRSNLDLIGACIRLDSHERLPGLPTWALDWSCQQRNPTTLSKPSACYLHNNGLAFKKNILTLEVCRISRVERCEIVKVFEFEDIEPFVKWVHGLISDSNNQYEGKKLAEVFFSALLAAKDMNQVVVVDGKLKYLDTSDLRAFFVHMLNISSEEFHELFREPTTRYQASNVMELLIGKLGSQRVFFSEQGKLGLGPEATREGDVLCVIPGMSSPALIRQTEDLQQYIWIGSCYLDGSILGEQLLGSFDFDPAIELVDVFSEDKFVGVCYFHKVMQKLFQSDPRLFRTLGDEFKPWEKGDETYDEWRQSTTRRATEKRGVRWEIVDVL